MKLCKGKPKQVITEKSLFDEDFECLKRVAYGILSTLGRPRDRILARKMIEYLSRLNNSENVQVKRDVNVFMRFYLRVLRWTQLNQPSALYRQWYGPGFYGDSLEGAVGGIGGDTSCSCAPGGANEYIPDSGEMRMWLEHNSSFLAMKSFADGSTIIYAAVSKNPVAGWVEGGMKSLRNRPECRGECVGPSCPMTMQ